MFPTVTRYLNKFIYHHNPQRLPRTSIVVSVSNSLPLYTDRHFDQSCDNCVIGLYAYTGGGPWIQHHPQKPPNLKDQQSRILPNGTTCQNIVHDTKQKAVRFRPGVGLRHGKALKAPGQL